MPQVFGEKLDNRYQNYKCSHAFCFVFRNSTSGIHAVNLPARMWMSEKKTGNHPSVHLEGLVYGIPALGYHIFVKSQTEEALSVPIRTISKAKHYMEKRAVLNSIQSVSSFGADQGTFSLYFFIPSFHDFICEPWAYTHCSKTEVFCNFKSDKTNVCAFLKYFLGKTLQKALSSLSLF